MARHKYGMRDWRGVKAALGSGMTARAAAATGADRLADIWRTLRQKPR